MKEIFLSYFQQSLHPLLIHFQVETVIGSDELLEGCNDLLEGLRLGGGLTHGSDDIGQVANPLAFVRLQFLSQLVALYHHHTVLIGLQLLVDSKGELHSDLKVIVRVFLWNQRIESFFKGHFS